uniref:Uncharacterized protein n=1 Tax=Rhizophora mucronata TaxID=61149 RepID=A0A2P2JAY4_RHIMU
MGRKGKRKFMICPARSETHLRRETR